MSGYFVANYEIVNEEAYQGYLQRVGDTLRAHGAEVLVADYKSVGIEGSPAPVTVVIRFESKEAAQRWYHSTEYQTVIRHRTENTAGVAAFCDSYTPIAP